jgi:hypothetical protein
MSRQRWLVIVPGLGVFAGAALVVARRAPDRLTVDVGAATRQARFRSAVTASGETVVMRAPRHE